MQMNIMQLIKEGKIGDVLKSRGGQRYKYNRYVFAKTKKNIVTVYEGYSYLTLKKDMEAEIARPVCTLTPDKIIFKLEKYDANGNWRKEQYKMWPMSGFLSLNFLFGCYTRFSQSQSLIETNNKGAVTPFSKMEFSWDGNLISEIPKKAQKRYDEWYQGVKDNRNAQSRARYAQQAAEREFRKYDAAGKLDEYPIENVFTIQNAQLRSYAINAIGLEKVLAPYPTEIIDAETIENQGHYELINIQLPSVSIYQWGRRTVSDPKWCLYLKMVNQSTGEYHLEGVPRESDDWNNHIPEETVRGALAWRDSEDPQRKWDGNKHIKSGDWKYIEPVILT